MKARKLLLAILLIYNFGLNAYGQLHPGPRATCPICNARLIKNFLSTNSIAFGTLPEFDKLRLLKKSAPEANPREILKVMDNMSALSIDHIHIERDNSFKAYTVQFGDGIKSKFYSVKDKSGDWQYSSNNVNDVFSQLSKRDGNSTMKYLLFDDIYSQESQSFMANVELHKSKFEKSKISAIPSDIYLNNNSPQRWGSALFESSAKVVYSSNITTKIINGIKKYTAKINLNVKGKNIAVIIYGKTKKAVQDFLNTFLSVFKSSPETSIAIAVNKSRLIRRSNVDVVYQEASVAQFVKRNSTLFLGFSNICKLYSVEIKTMNTGG